MVSTHLKNISQNGNLPQVGMKIKNLWKPPPRCTCWWMYQPFPWDGWKWKKRQRNINMMIFAADKKRNLTCVWQKGPRGSKRKNTLSPRTLEVENGYMRKVTTIGRYTDFSLPWLWENGKKLVDIRQAQLRCFSDITLRTWMRWKHFKWFSVNIHLRYVVHVIGAHLHFI